MVFVADGDEGETQVRRFDVLHLEKDPQVLFGDRFEVTGVSFDRTSGVAVAGVREGGDDATFRLEEWRWRQLRAGRHGVYV